MKNKIKTPNKFISVYDNELEIFKGEEARLLKMTSYTYLVYACLKQQYKYKLSVKGRASTSTRSIERMFEITNVSREIKKILTHSSNIISRSENGQLKVNCPINSDSSSNAIPVALLTSEDIDVKDKQFLAVINRYLDRTDDFSLNWSKWAVWTNAFKPLGRSKSWTSDRITSLMSEGFIRKTENGYMFDMEAISDYVDREILALKAQVKGISPPKQKGFNEFDYGIDI